MGIELRLALCWLPLWYAVGDPVRCLVKGFYQEYLLTFGCQGSSGNLDDNRVTGKLRPKASLLQVIPKATRGLRLILDSKNRASMFLFEPDGNTPIGRTGVDTPMPYKDIQWGITGAPGEPTYQSIYVSGSLPNELILKVFNLENIPILFTISYIYQAYLDPVVSPQCSPGGVTVGCAPYDGFHTRDAISDWSCKARSMYGTEDRTWRRLAAAEAVGPGVPWYAWCNVWSQMEVRPNLKKTCKTTYKFITRGGFEVGRQMIYRSQFNWAFKTCAMRDFFNKCCGILSRKWRTVERAWEAWTKRVNRPLNSSSLASADSGPWESCTQMLESPSGISKADFLMFLDVNGENDLQMSEVQSCWHLPNMNSSHVVQAQLAPSSQTMPAETVPQPKQSNMLAAEAVEAVAAAATAALTLQQSMQQSSKESTNKSNQKTKRNGSSTPTASRLNTSVSPVSDSGWSSVFHSSSVGAASLNGDADFAQWMAVGLPILCLCCLAGLVIILCSQTQSAYPDEASTAASDPSHSDGSSGASDGEEVPLLSERPRGRLSLYQPYDHGHGPIEMNQLVGPPIQQGLTPPLGLSMPHLRLY